jgi:quercetin dioxygenase-like cupin family protein
VKNFGMWSALIVGVGAILATSSLATPPAAQDAPVMVAPADIKWMDGPPALPPGAKVAPILGDSKNEGPFVMRAKLPADYKVPPHFHPGNETVTVISGTFYAAMGDTFDAAKAKAMPTGSFIMLPAKSPHFVYTKEETIIQINAVGPWTLTYVNPADDPRNKK